MFEDLEMEDELVFNDPLENKNDDSLKNNDDG